jgi:hypothetical protein
MDEALKKLHPLVNPISQLYAAVWSGRLSQPTAMPGQPMLGFPHLPQSQYPAEQTLWEWPLISQPQLQSAIQPR